MTIKNLRQLLEIGNSASGDNTDSVEKGHASGTGGVCRGNGDLGSEACGQQTDTDSQEKKTLCTIEPRQLQEPSREEQLRWAKYRAVIDDFDY